MEQEVNSLGEVYNWEFVPAELTTWDEATKKWDSTGTNQPWDTYGNNGGWKISTVRNLHIIENTSSLMKRFTKEYISLIDAIFTNKDIVFSDVDFRDNGLSLEELKRIAINGTPIEYEDTRPLVPGEYTYEKAIVGIKMRTFNLSTKLGFYKAILNVDVEDIVSRGSVEVTSTDINKPTRVEYKKFYYNPPEEIMFNVTEFSEPCTVEVLTKTTKEFTFMLRSTVTNNYVTGKVSWLATGY
jgi:hypothetical protein